MNRFTDAPEATSDHSLTRRDLFRGAAAALVPLVVPPAAFAAQAAQTPAGAAIGPLDPAVLPQGVRSRFVEGVNGLRMLVRPPHTMPMFWPSSRSTFSLPRLNPSPVAERMTTEIIPHRMPNIVRKLRSLLARRF